jgi:hypothetical protein
VGVSDENEIEHQRATGRPQLGPHPFGQCCAAFPAETAVDLADTAQEGTVMDLENTDLERRVLAHEQILQVLIAHMAEAEPKFLDRLQQIFTKHHTLGAGEQDYTGTAAYAEQFIQQVVRLRDKGRRS